MGWSIDIVREEVEAIFKAKDIKCTVDRPDSMQPNVYITYDTMEDIPLETKRAIVKKFPDNVHISFAKAHLPEPRNDDINS